MRTTEPSTLLVVMLGLAFCAPNPNITVREGSRLLVDELAEVTVQRPAVTFIVSGSGASSIVVSHRRSTKTPLRAYLNDVCAASGAKYEYRPLEPFAPFARVRIYFAGQRTLLPAAGIREGVVHWNLK